MSQIKPSWIKTLVSWENKKIIWWHWFRGLTLRQTTKIFLTSGKKYPDAPVTVDTIRKVRQELLDMPVELLDNLVEEEPGIEPFVKEKRPDFLEERPTRYLPPSPHTKELSITALAMAKNYEKIVYGSPISTDVPHCLGKVMFMDMACTDLLSLEIIDEEKATDIFAHLKVEFDELKDIKSWDHLEVNKITLDFAHRLEHKSYEGKFKGRCPHCPK